MSDVCCCLIPTAAAVKLGIMQPYFFPYLGHFALIAAVDEWVVFDVTQYTRKSWINRNRILRAAGGWQYVSAPLVNSSIHISIAEAAFASPSDLEKYVLGKLSHYARHAPHYRAVCDIVRTALARSTGSSLVSLNVSGLRTVCDYLGLAFRHRICSQLALEFPQGLTAGQWAPWIAARFRADVYVNPIGGRELFNPVDFAARGIQLQFLDFKPFVYDTPGYAFEGSLSILDVLMWNTAAVVRQAIHDNSTLISKA
jgi:WbqC-like protein family